MSYSIDMLVKSAFSHEIRSVLDLVEIAYQDETHITIKEYLEKRIKEIDRTHNGQSER